MTGIPTTWTLCISIHALREEGDVCGASAGRNVKHFYPRPPRGGRLSRNVISIPLISISIHALREEGDSIWNKLLDQQDRFLSTPSARRATLVTFDFDVMGGYFYPRPPRGGRPETGKELVNGVVFLSTPSARRATSCLELQMKT